MKTAYQWKKYFQARGVSEISQTIKYQDCQSFVNSKWAQSAESKKKKKKCPETIIHNWQLKLRSNRATFKISPFELWLDNSYKVMWCERQLSDGFGKKI